MGYYERQDLPFYYALADAFTIGDNYHCSVLGPTHPNRLMALSGTVDPTGHAGGPVLETSSSPDVIYSAHWDTIPEVLEDAGVSWKVYNPTGSIYLPPFFEQHGILSDAILPYFAQYKNPSSALYQKAFLPQYPSDFAADVASGQLPAVSWLIPPAGYDEHPSAPPALGEYYTSQVLATLTSNPEVWSKTVLFHMYDENDGFFDHVPPPVPPAGTPGEYLTQHTLPSDAKGIRGPVGMSFRVPLLVISPFSRGGHVASQVFDHTSQMRFLEERFGVRAPNISAWRRKTAGDLTSHPAPRSRRRLGAGAAQHRRRHDGRDHGQGHHRGPDPQPRQRHADLPGAAAPEHAAAGAGVGPSESHVSSQLRWSPGTRLTTSCVTDDRCTHAALHAMPSRGFEARLQRLRLW